MAMAMAALPFSIHLTTSLSHPPHPLTFPPSTAFHSLSFSRGSNFVSIPHGLFSFGIRPPLHVPTRLSAHASLFAFLERKDKEILKQDLLEAIAPLDRGAEASSEDQFRIEKIVQDLETVNPNKKPLQSPLLNGKWKLLYTTSASILKKQRPKLLRPGGPIFQAINTDTLRAQNLETWPFYNQVTANLTPLSESKVAVKFDVFKIGGLISVKAPDRARGELQITYLDEELRISRGDKGNLFVLRMVDPSYRVPV